MVCKVKENNKEQFVFVCVELIFWGVPLFWVVLKERYKEQRQFGGGGLKKAHPHDHPPIGGLVG